jgi:hypothetical protein
MTSNRFLLTVRILYSCVENQIKKAHKNKKMLDKIPGAPDILSSM